MKNEKEIRQEISHLKKSKATRDRILAIALEWVIEDRENMSKGTYKYKFSRPTLLRIDDALHRLDGTGKYSRLFNDNYQNPRFAQIIEQKYGKTISELRKLVRGT